MSEYYYKGDPLGWAQRAVDNHAEFRADLERSQKNPVYQPSSVVLGIATLERRMMLGLKNGISSEAVEVAEACVEKLRNIRGFFQFLRDEVYLTAVDESTNKYVLGIVDETVQDDEALTSLVRPATTPESIVALIERHRENTKAAGLRRMQIQIAVFKLRTLQKTIETKQS